MRKINYQKLSPFGTDEFPCFETYTSYHAENRTIIIDNIVFKVAINPINRRAETMNVKLPYTEENKSTKIQVVNQLSSSAPAVAMVRFENLCCYSYTYNGKRGFTGYASKLILEEK